MSDGTRDGNLLIIPRDLTGDFPRGTWRLTKRDGFYVANFSCPRCGARGGLGHGTNHTIADDGSVSPSVVCDDAACGYHDFIKLDGWSMRLVANDDVARAAKEAGERVLRDARVDPEMLSKPTI